jgi:hypothetical protein
MQDLHHSDILTYALTRLGTEFSRDKQGTLKGLQECIDETANRRGLGSVRHEDLDEAGPGYSIRTPQVGPGKVEDEVTSIQVK